MSGPRSRIVLAAVSIAAFVGAAASRAQFYDLPPLPKPELYGAVLMDAVASAAGAEAVSFSHASHRRQASCRVCHVELGFAMEAGATGVDEAANRDGEYCGACHNGQVAFGHVEGQCGTCHTGDLVAPDGLRRALRKLPRRKYGNGVDWTMALEEGQVAPLLSLYEADRRPIPFEEEIDVPVPWALIPPARFSHATHLPWLDCAECHPDLFAVRRRGKGEMSMRAILEGRYCGQCHGSVALPLDDCRACHPTMRER